METYAHGGEVFRSAPFYHWVACPPASAGLVGLCWCCVSGVQRTNRPECCVRYFRFSTKPPPPAPRPRYPALSLVSPMSLSVPPLLM